MIRFLLNTQQIELDGCAPETTLLSYLRTQLGQTGTKEGCASGDCGACTVVQVSLQGGQLIYKTLNSCITPLATIDGSQLLTIEHLEQQGALHPMQQAMVEQHGSQCGFCTPGIVNSLFVYRQQHPAYQRESAIDALAGNLCRCTGYRPILAAAEAGFELPWEDGSERSIALLEQLQTQPNSEIPSLGDQNGRCFMPRNMAQLFSLMAQYPNARLVAGGSDLMLEVTQQLKQFPQLISLQKLSPPREVSVTDDCLEIGSALTLTEVLPYLKTHFPAFADLLHRFASLQIRNVATIGGSIANASPIGDIAPVLLALDGELLLASSEGERRVPIDQFFTGYKQTLLRSGECISAVCIPLLADGQTLNISKLSKRLDDDISAVCFAASIQLSGKRIERVRIGVGGMAATPVRAQQTETLLTGQLVDDALIERAAEMIHDEFQPMDDLRASAAYRREAIAGLLRRCFIELSDETVKRVEQYA